MSAPKAEQLKEGLSLVQEQQEDERQRLEKQYAAYCASDIRELIQGRSQGHLEPYFEAIQEIIVIELHKLFKSTPEIPFLELLKVYQDVGQRMVTFLDQLSAGDTPLQQPDYIQLNKGEYSPGFRMLYEVIPALNHPGLPKNQKARRYFAVNVLFKEAMAQQIQNWSSEGLFKMENGKAVALILNSPLENANTDDHQPDFSLPQLENKGDGDTTQAAPALETFLDEDPSEAPTQLTPAVTLPPRAQT